MPLDKFVKRFSFNTAVHNDIFEEACKLRAARRIWYKIITERYGITDPNCAKFRVHVQSSGSTHTYQEPYNNIIRIAFQVLAGVLGGAQSIHANGYDEAICLASLAADEIEVTDLISQRFPLDDAMSALTAAQDGRNLKVLIQP